MSRWYVDQDRGFVDYGPGFTLVDRWFRGQPPGDEPYFVVLGAAQAFGRLRSKPFGTIVAEHMRLPCVNLGAGGTSYRLYQKPPMLEVINRAVLAIICVVSARMSSNSAFKPVGDNRWGLLADGTQVSADDFWQLSRSNCSRETLALLCDESRHSYVGEANFLLNSVRVPTVLLWFGSAKAPDYASESRDWNNESASFPHLVGAREMAKILRPEISFVAAQSGVGLPEYVVREAAASSPFGGLSRADGWIVNKYYPSAAMHEHAARKLVGELDRL